MSPRSLKPKLQNRALTARKQRFLAAVHNFWVSSYMPQHCPEFYRGVGTTRQLLVKLDEIHATIRQRMPNAQPPRHTYEWTGSTSLIMGYWSHRPLMQLFLGSVNGVARHYGESIRTRKVDEQHVEIVFPA